MVVRVHVFFFELADERLEFVFDGEGGEDVVELVEVELDCFFLLHPSSRLY